MISPNNYYQSPSNVITDCALVNLFFAGFNFFCCICSDGSLWVAGNNGCGQLGLGHKTFPVTNATKNNYFNDNGLVLKDITCATNGHHQIALTNDGQVHGTGRNSNHELGFSDGSNRTQFTKIPYFETNKLRVKAVECANQYSTFLTNNGAVYVCGTSPDGGLGLGSDVRQSKTVRKVDILNDTAMTHIASGYGHTLSIDEDGWVWSWGSNSSGQLGNGRMDVKKKGGKKDSHKKKKGRRRMMMKQGTNDQCNRTLPQKIAYFVEKDIKTIAIDCGMNHNLSLDSKHRIHAWGYNQSSQCGFASSSPVLRPKPIPALKNVDIVDIKAGISHNVAMSKDFQFYFWGTNSSHQCITGDTSNVSVPIKFDAQNNLQLSGGTVLSIWPGSNTTHIIALSTVKEHEKLKKLLLNEIDNKYVLKASIKRMANEVKESRETLQNKDDEIKDNKKSLEAQEKQIQFKSREIDRLHKDATAQQQQIRSLQETLQTQEKQNGSMVQQISQLKEWVQTQDKENQSVTKQLKGLQREIIDRNSDIERMSKEIEGHQKSIKSQQAQIQSKSRQIDGFQKDAALQQQQIRSLQEKLQTQEKQNVSMVQQTNQLKERVQIQEREKQSMTEQLKGLQGDIQIRDGNIEKMKKQIESQQKAYKVQEKANQSKTQQIVHLQERLQDKDQEEQTLRQTLRTREEENTSMVQQLERLQQEAERRAEDINRLNGEIAQNRRTLQQQEEEKLSMTNQLERARIQGTAGEQKIEALQERLRRSYTLSAVRDENKQTDEKEDENEEKEQERAHGDGALYKKHGDIVTEWNVLTEKLQQLAHPLDGANEDEKQPVEQQQKHLPADELLHEYDMSNRLMSRQKERLKLVEDNSHLSELILHKKALRVKFCVRCTMPLIDLYES